MTKKKLVTCSPFMLIMGYEYSKKDDQRLTLEGKIIRTKKEIKNESI